MQPSEPTRPLTPEEAAALAAIVAETGPPPQPAYIPESSAPPPVAPAATAPTYQTDASTAYGNYAPPPTPPETMSSTDPILDRLVKFVGVVPSGWQRGMLGTTTTKAGGMTTSYPGGGSGGGVSLGTAAGRTSTGGLTTGTGVISPLIFDDLGMRVQAPQNATPGGGSILNPAYVPREPGPGQYEPPYHEPGVYTTLPPYRPPMTDTDAYEPGMYEGRYERPGQAVPPPAVNEPGMYEPAYTQPGYYTPRSASTYYGGQIWPALYTGKERLEAGGAVQFGPNPASVQVITPTTGETTFRGVPDLGTAKVLMEGPERYHDTQPDPALTNRGQIFGGNVPPVPTVTLGTTSNALAYMASQNDPRVTTNDEGRLVLIEDLPPDDRVFRRLAGLFGGTSPNSVSGRFTPSTTPVAPTGLKPLNRKPR